ncbi:HD-GYP domain-containing protein [Methylomagnum sp.]
MTQKRPADRKVVEWETVKVPASDLRIGMFISELDRPWLGTPFLLQGFEVKTRDDIVAVQGVCEYVYVDMIRTRRLDPLENFRPTATRGPASYAYVPNSTAPIHQEMGKAKAVQNQTSSLISTFIDDIQHGRSVDIQLARSAVSECVSSILRNSEAIMLLTQIKNKDEYTSQHSFNVCVYSVLLGRHIGLKSPDLEDAGLCGLLHDMGKIRVPVEILNKEARLEDDELAVMQSHTVHGREILSSGRNVFNGTVDVAYGHHENMDGTGYPRGLAGHQTNLLTKIVAVVDKYDAITSDRVYRQGRPHLEAVGILQKQFKEKIDPNLATAFIACLGVYPSGSVVELSSGEIAVVIEHNPMYQLRPRIIVCRDKDKRPIPEKLVDLAERPFDDQGKPYAIWKQHRPDAFGIDLRSFQNFINRPVW